MAPAPVVGVDVGSAAVKVARISRPGGVPTLAGSAVQRYRDGNLLQTLREALERAAGGVADVVLGLGSPELIVKPFQVPNVPKYEVAGAIGVEAERCLSGGLPIRDAVADWHLMSTSNQSMRGVLAVAPKHVVASRVRVARAAGVRPVVVDVDGLAAWNAYWLLVGHRQAPGRTVLLANVGAASTNLVIARSRDELLLARDLRLGAEAIGRGQGAAWTGEVSEAIASTRAVGGARALDVIVLTGGGAPDALPLAHALAVPVSLWNPLEQLGPEGLPGEPPPQEGFQLAVAIGLALRRPA